MKHSKLDKQAQETGLGPKTSNRRSFLRQFGALSVAGAGLAVSACQQKPSENLPEPQSK